MSNKAKYLNYLTFILCILSLCITIYSSFYNIRSIYATVCILITLVIYFISRRQNFKEIYLTKEEKEKFKISKGEKDG